VKWSESTDIFATLDGTTKAFTTPDLYPGDSSRLYRGLGAGAFEDVTERAGVHDPRGKALGAAVGDIDGDGWIDVAVANDTHPNFLFRNEGGRFREIAKEAGVAYDASGRARAGMGIDVARLPPERRTAIAIGNFTGEPLSLYVESGPCEFTESAARAGLAAATTLPLTFGLAFLDVDLDGTLDLALANGHIEPTIASIQRETSYAQAPSLFLGRADGTFRDVARAAGPPFARPIVGRGLAAADLDSDGDPDLALSQNGGRARVLRCDRAGAASAHRFLRLRLRGPAGNPAALGAVVRATVAGRTIERTVRTGSSYLSQSETSLVLGLGASASVEQLEVLWPDGRTTRRRDIAASGEPLVLEP
jgi:hypothetical protein